MEGGTACGPAAPGNACPAGAPAVWAKALAPAKSETRKIRIMMARPSSANKWQEFGGDGDIVP
jgi:hypothetical protein